jgi:hypothetical protein
LNDRRHGGVITNGAVMTMTSGPLETKPITRGAWIAGVIFNSPPPPPPAEVPPLPEEKELDESLTLRERFADHRERADCAGCHEKLDPWGLPWRILIRSGVGGKNTIMAGMWMQVEFFSEPTNFPM